MPSTAYPCRLYLVSPPKLTPDTFVKTLDAALAAGDVAAFQLRLKHATDAQIIVAVEALMPVTRAHGVAFMLNDRVDLAATLGVDGVHLGQEDMPIAQARTLLGEQTAIGISCHDSSHLAMEAAEAGADYVAFGAFHPTRSKEPAQLAKYGTPTLELLQSWAMYTTVPCVAIGGLTPENCKPIVAAGADFIAAIHAIWEHPQGAAAAVREFNDSIKHTLKNRIE